MNSLTIAWSVSGDCEIERLGRGKVQDNELENSVTLKERLPAFAIMVVLAGGLAVITWKFVAAPGGGSTISVKVPVLTALAARGRQVFETRCAACHGVNAAGTDKGPPLVHDIYNPGHHGDAAFLSAARRGVQQHHWRFGNMAPLPEVSDQEISLIIRYIRQLQEANGITYRPHRM